MHRHKNFTLDFISEKRGAEYPPGWIVRGELWYWSL